MSQLALAVHLWDSISQQEVTPDPEIGANQRVSSRPSSSQRRYVGRHTGTSHSEMLGAFAERQSITPKSGPDMVALRRITPTFIGLITLFRRRKCSDLEPYQ